MDNNMSIGALTTLINTIMGQEVLSEDQMQQIMDGAKEAFDSGGISKCMEYLLEVTDTKDVKIDDLTKFAESIKDNPAAGFDILAQEMPKGD